MNPLIGCPRQTGQPYTIYTETIKTIADYIYILVHIHIYMFVTITKKKKLSSREMGKSQTEEPRRCWRGERERVIQFWFN